MEFKKIVFLLIFGVIFIAGCTQPTQPQQPQEPIEPAFETNSGNLIISITDQESYQQDFDAINITIDEIEVQMQEKWSPFFSGKKTFNLFELVGVNEIIEQKSIQAGNYSAIRFLVSKAEIAPKEGEPKSISVPSNKIVLSKNFSVQEGQTTEMVIDFDPYSVVLVQGNYLLQPDPLIKFLNIEEFEQKLEDDKIMEEEAEKEEFAIKLEQLVFPDTVSLDDWSANGIEFKWKVSGGNVDEGNGVISHTAVHWDIVGGHEASIEQYPYMSEILQGNSPQNFTVLVGFPPLLDLANEDTILYFRVHALIDQEHYYSDEMSITLKAALEPPLQPQAKEFEVLADDSKFDPQQITVNEGNLVRITFNVPTTKVSWGGEDIRSEYFNTGVIKPGEYKTVEFTAPAVGFQINSYWPHSSQLKATMTVAVE